MKKALAESAFFIPPSIIEQTVYNSHMKIVSWNVNGLRSLTKNGYWESF